MSANNKAEGQVKIYLRNHHKIAKKIQLSPNQLASLELFQQASRLFELNPEQIHLYYCGQLVDREGSITLQDNSIVHVVDTERLKLERIKVRVKKVDDCRIVKNFQISSQLTIKQFFNSYLEPELGISSKRYWLINMGRQLQEGKNFRQFEIQTQSELLCIEKEPHQIQQQMHQQVPKEQTKSEQQHDQKTFNIHKIKSCPSGGYQPQNDINIHVRQSENSHKNKDIYPLPNFTIETPDEIPTTNKLNLIFDAKVRKSSTVMDIDFSPDDIIPQQCDAEGNMSMKSEHYSDVPIIRQSSKQSCRSEGATMRMSMQGEVAKSRNISDGEKDVGSGGNRGVSGDNLLLYTQDINGVNGRGMMNDLLHELKDKSESNIEENKEE